MRHRTFLGALFSGIFGIIFFIIAMIILNILTAYVSSAVFLQVVAVLNSNFALILVFSIIFFIGDLVYTLFFPFNLPAPIINAVGAMFLVAFLINLFEFVNVLISGMPVRLRWLGFIYPLVFILVLITGYASILIPGRWERRQARWGRRHEYDDAKSQPESRRDSKRHSWKQVGDEFREFMYDAISKMRDEIRQKPKKKT